MEDTDQVVFYEPRLLLVEVGEGRFSTVLQHGDGTVERLPVTTPARDLIAAAEINYWPYRREIKRLRDDHPLFAARLDIPVADFEDFMTETLLLPSMLQKIDPVGFFALGVLLDQVLQREDDGSALFLLDAAQELLHVLEEPICTQIYLRNILEMAFDGRERATQKERFEKLCQIYPQIGRLCDPASLPDVEQGQRVFRANSVFGLRMLELALYFQQDKQRIARCDYCWGWFIPKTKKVTRYCDRVAEEFLQRIDTTHELGSYEADKAELVEEMVWQRRGAGDFSFDPETYYPEMIQVLDLGAAEPKWEIYTADHLRKQEQQGHQSLREKHGKR